MTRENNTKIAWATQISRRTLLWRLISRYWSRSHVRLRFNKIKEFIANYKLSCWARNDSRECFAGWHSTKFKLVGIRISFIVLLLLFFILVVVNIRGKHRKCLL